MERKVRAKRVVDRIYLYIVVFKGRLEITVKLI